jgi:aspartate/methionine/tyrosine aminotransferase
MCHPNNPTGVVWKESILKKIRDIAGEYDTPIISDEIYGLITYDNIKARSVFNVSGDVPSIIISGMSKFFMRPGWRIGYMCFNDPEEKIADVLQTSKKVATMYGHPNKSIPSPILFAAAKAYQDYKGTYEAGINMIKETKIHRDYILKRINEIAGIECLKPEGTLYAFPKILGIGKKWKTDLDFQVQLMKEEKVTWHIGRRYGVYGGGHMRILMQPTLERLEDGFNRLSRFMSKHT